MDLKQDTVVLIDKPAGRTSFNIFSEVRKILKIKKIGHSGTLDLAASGLLVACTGSATRLTRFFLESDKRYTATLKLGIVTDSCDTEGEVLETRPVEGVTKQTVEDVLSEFKGDIIQIPPVYSALKINGRRASDLAREGRDVKMKERKIRIDSIDLTDCDLDNDSFTIDVKCSKGTYIRSLAFDIGQRLGTGAHLSDLRRTESGIFNVENAATIEEIREFSSGADIEKKFVLDPVDALKGFSRMIVDCDAESRIMNGAPFNRNNVLLTEEKDKNLFIILNKQENLIAIADIAIDKWQIKYYNVFNNRA